MASEDNGFARLLDRFEAQSLYSGQKGALFEQAVKVYLQNEPKWQDELERVWLWKEWAPAEGDYGVDLVAKRKTGETVAIQAKFYGQGESLPRRRIESFVSSLATGRFDEGILVATVPTTALASELLQELSKPVHTITLHDLERSCIEWGRYFKSQKIERRARQQLRPYQGEARADVLKGFKRADRGKLVMACGTGKTLTALRIAEKQVGAGGLVLFLVPSLNLISQTLRVFTQEAEIPLHSFAVCSDSEVGKRKGNGDPDDIHLHELEYPATTDARALARAFAKRKDSKHLNVIFGTYHSIEVIREAQRKHGLPQIDLMICDEAHRTTGRHVKGEDAEAAFMRVHNPDFIHAAKRLYMTATPKIWAANQKQAAANADQVLYSMDDEEQFGKTFHYLSFSDAVNKYQVLCDYKVVVLEVDEHEVATLLQDKLAEDNSLVVDDAGKILGCWRALAKLDSKGRFSDDPLPMRRAVAYAPVIDALKVRRGSRPAPAASGEGAEGKGSRAPRKHFLGSIQYSEQFQSVVDAFRASEGKEALESSLKVEARHVDGSMGAFEKTEALEWLGSDPEANTCRILSNVRCLSEGVDVPALDAVLFLSPRKSITEVVQTVGRVMRKSPGKKLGYVVIPVVVPFNADPNEVLDKNPAYEVVWEVLRALRAHDDKFEAMINRIDYEGRDDEKLIILRGLDRLPALTGKRKSQEPSRTETVARAARGSQAIGQAAASGALGEQGEFQWIIQTAEKWDRALMARIVEKCGTRLYWSVWAADIAKIANTHISRLTAILDRPANREERAAFEEFLAELHADINESISRQEAIEMLAQHLVTRPVFEALFKDYRFSDQNPVARAMSKVLGTLEPHRLEKEAATLEALYDGVRRRAEDTRTAKGRQALLAELYDKFFSGAFPKLTQRLGIVYTPVEVVDFIIQSVNQALQKEFGCDLSSDGVHILDPFAGTGTFITRLLQSGLISKERLSAKYDREIHANEIVLLAYYIAAINIESAFYEASGTKAYEPFPGICLTDTFNVGTDKGQQALSLEDNSRRLRKQRQLDIRVIFGNPPYSVGQESANDFNANLPYPELDARISATYAAASQAILKSKLYDSYFRAFRWASDRIRDAGVIGFVTNAGWIDSNSADGFRKCLAEEFSTLYVFNLRGNAHLSGERRRKEAGNVFGAGSRAPVSISVLVKNPKAKAKGEIFYLDVGDYLSREEKLRKVAELGGIEGIRSGPEWARIEPDAHHDWVNQRDPSFAQNLPLGEVGGTPGIFDNYSAGVLTARDAWCYNFSEQELRRNIGRSIRFYNAEAKRWAEATPKERTAGLGKFLTIDPKKFSWGRPQRRDLEKGRRYRENESGYRLSLYRPFTRQHVYFDRSLNDFVGQLPKLFPDSEAENRVICVSGKGQKVAFSALIADCLPSLHSVDIDGTQCFPLYLYEPVENGDAGPQDETEGPGQGALDLGGAGARSETRGKEHRLSKDGKYRVREAITDAAIARFRAALPGEKISKKDVFYYIYGLLHSEEYRERYASNLQKELARIPVVRRAEQFRSFVGAGEQLSKLHLGFDSVKLHPARIEYAKKRSEMQADDYRVTKMRFGKPSEITPAAESGDRREKWDRTVVHYNECITIRDIPLDAYDYVVNGKSAIEWVMERQAVSTDTTTGIVNDANIWAEEQGNSRYPLDLLLRVITVSLETLRIVKALPALAI